MSKVLIISKRAERCGIAQYGKRVSNILKKSTEHEYDHLEVDNGIDFLMGCKYFKPDVVIYNYYAPLYPWLTDDFLKYHDLRKSIKHGVLFHELWTNFTPDFIITNDTTAVEHGMYFNIPRPLFENIDFCNFSKKETSLPVIGTFGFGFRDKNYNSLTEMVCKQFDKAVLRMHIPFAEFGDNEGNLSKSTFNECEGIIKNINPGIKLEYDSTFLTDEELLKYLYKNDINVFLYTHYGNRGLSSTIDYALSVKKPIAISNSEQFRHIDKYVSNAYHKILPDIINIL